MATQQTTPTRSQEQAARRSADADARERLLAGLPLIERRLELDGVSTSVLEGGAGPPLILLHGGIECGGVYWAPVVSGLAEHHRLVIPDVPGLGESEPLAQLDAEVFRRWFAALARETCDESPALVAHSLLGSLAPFVAQREPLVRQLVVYGAPGVGPYRIPLGLMVAAVRCDLRPSRRNQERFERWAFLDLEQTSERDPEWLDSFDVYAVSRSRVRHVKRTMRRLIKTCTKRVPDAELRGVEVPAALLWGRYDRMVPLRLAEEASSRLTWPLHVVDGAGHVPHIEQPAAFCDALHAALDTPLKPEERRRKMATHHAYTAVHPGVAGREGGLVRLSAEQLDDLDSHLEGSLLCAGDEGWDAAIEVWNAMASKIPALVVQPASAEDVATTVAFARDHGLLLSVKGGGHNIAGTAIADGGLTLDMSRLRGVAVDPDERRVHVGPGCLLGDVDGATQEHGLATVLGFVSETGVAGLTLGGGFGYLARRFGWAADNVEEVEIVTADGRIRIANRLQEPELHWAVRGGGGNFGVVTRFTFRLHDIGPMVTGGLMLWGAERGDEVLATYRDLTESGPRELTLGAVVLTVPPAPFVPPAWHGRQAIGIICCHTGPNAKADLERLRALEEPIVDLVAERPYVEQQSMFNDMDPSGLCQYWKTEYLSELTADYCDTFRDAALAATSPLSYSVIFHIGGALNERAGDDGAAGNRDARFVTGFSGVWTPDDARADEHIAWARAGWERIRPFSTGGNYVNFQLAEDDAGRTQAAYGENYARLRQAKAVYDPENLFRVNRNIPPASPGAAD